VIPCTPLEHSQWMMYIHLLAKIANGNTKMPLQRIM
jgi:hypothetical protein